MVQGTTVDLKELVMSSGTFGPPEVETIRSAISKEIST